MDILRTIRWMVLFRSQVVEFFVLNPFTWFNMENIHENVIWLDFLAMRPAVGAKWFSCVFQPYYVDTDSLTCVSASGYLYEDFARLKCRENV